MLSFKVFSFPPGQDFVPSTATFRFWLYTKKNKRTFGGVFLPGIFETVGYPTQMIAFFTILALEVAPTVYGIGQGVMWQAIAVAILVDIFLALVAHFWHEGICECQNRIVVEANPVTKVFFERKMSKYQLITNSFYVLILVSGVAKFYFFYDAYMISDFIAAGVLICYLSGAILHIRYTGYFLYTSHFNHKIQSEYSEYVRTGGQTNKNVIGVLELTLLTDGAPMKTFAIGNHCVRAIDSKSYILETTGALTDTELANLVVNQPFNMQGLVARVGLEHQLTMI